MTLVNRKKYAGRPDINEQFTAANIRKTLTEYKKVKESDGDYTFGALTAKFYQLSDDATAAWENDINAEYPHDVQAEIKRHIIHALTHRDQHGHESPIPLTIKWSGGTKAVVCTYNPSGPSYKVEIIGYLAPSASPLSKRRPNK
jgi:hypothetical protein